MIKNTYIYSVVAVVVIGGFIFLMNQDSKTGDVVDNFEFVVSPTPTFIPTLTPTPLKSSPKPTPKLIVKEINQYQYWVGVLEPINRRLTLDENCTSIVPSQVSYPNNTKIMLDNTFSASPRVLKIGNQEYSLPANDWELITLSDSKLPAQLNMFCGSMELGQLELR
ncbi:MAG: hypothetical protein AAB638_01905 [Patescibacteria group bacterium]